MPVSIADYERHYLELSLIVADLTETDLRAAFSAVGNGLVCEECRAAVADRVNILALRWSMVKVQSTSLR